MGEEERPAVDALLSSRTFNQGIEDLVQEKLKGLLRRYRGFWIVVAVLISVIGSLLGIRTFTLKDLIDDQSRRIADLKATQSSQQELHKGQRELLDERRTVVDAEKKFLNEEQKGLEDRLGLLNVHTSILETRFEDARKAQAEIRTLRDDLVLLKSQYETGVRGIAEFKAAIEQESRRIVDEQVARGLAVVEPAMKTVDAKLGEVRSEVAQLQLIKASHMSRRIVVTADEGWATTLHLDRRVRITATQVHAGAGENRFAVIELSVDDDEPLRKKLSLGEVLPVPGTSFTLSIIGFQKGSFRNAVVMAASPVGDPALPRTASDAVSQMRLPGRP